MACGCVRPAAESVSNRKLNFILNVAFLYFSIYTTYLNVPLRTQRSHLKSEAGGTPSHSANFRCLLGVTLSLCR